MGLLRFLLALNVAYSHLGPIFGFIAMPGTFAVYAFYIISGFYMSLILNEKYIGKNSIKLFLSNRLLRIYPLYWIVLAITILVFLLAGNSLNNPLISFFNNYRLYQGLELVMVFIFDFLRNVFIVTNSSYYNPSIIYTGLIVIGTSWTLGLELLFYLIAPFIVRRNLLQVFLIFLGSYLLRELTNTVFAVKVNNTTLVDPGFFPSVFIFFILGVLSYKVYSKAKKLKISFKLTNLILIAIALYTIFYHYIPVEC